MGIFSSKSKTTTLEPMLTEDQKKAMSLLTQFGSTGQLGDFQAGQGYDLSGFTTGLTPAEIMGGSQLEGLLSSGTPEALTTAQKTLTGIANLQFNPDDPSSEFGAFNRQLQRQTQGASDALNREAAITGGRFGTGIQRQKADLGAQVADVQASKLAQLYSDLQGKKMAAAGGLADIAQAQEAMTQNRINAAYTYGQRQKEIQNEKAQLAYDDWQRARNERLQSITGLNQVMGTNVQWGQKSYTSKSPSLFSQLAGTVLSGAGTALGGALGGAAAGGISSLFSGAAGSTSASTDGSTMSDFYL